MNGLVLADSQGIATGILQVLAILLLLAIALAIVTFLLYACWKGIEELIENWPIYAAVWVAIFLVATLIGAAAQPSFGRALGIAAAVATGIVAVWVVLASWEDW
jgi:hypothetical protein